MRTDAETEDLVISGMGELHIDVVKDRLLTEYGLNITLGPIQVAYREGIHTHSENVTMEVNRSVRSHQSLLSGYF